MKRKKQILYFVLLLDTLVLMLSGFILRFGAGRHQGRRFQIDDALLPRPVLCDLHFLAAMLMIVLLAYHFWLCRRQIKGLMR